MTMPMGGIIKTRTPRELNDAIREHPYPMFIEYGVPEGHITITCSPRLKIVHSGPVGEADSLIYDPLEWYRKRECAKAKG